MSKNEKKQGKSLEEIIDFDALFKEEVEKDPLIQFKCIDCGCVDPVPEFVVSEFSYGLEPDEEVEMHCPECNGTMREAKEQPKDE